MTHISFTAPANPSPPVDRLGPTDPAHCSYALLRSGPAVASSEVELAHVEAIEVMVLWGTNVLHVAHVDPNDGFFVGETEGKEGTCHFVLPRGLLGARRLPLLLGAGDAALLIVPPTATGHLERPDEPALELSAARAQARLSDVYDGCVELPLSRGARARIELGGLVFQIAVVKAGKPTKKGFGAALDFDVAAYFGLSLLSFGGLVAAMAYFAPPLELEDDEGISKERLVLLLQSLNAAAERQQEQRPQETAENASPEGGTGTRAAGESGSLGKATAPAASRRYQVKGPRENTDLRLARAAALRDARDFGFVGLLRADLAGDPNAPTAPWGGDTALGNGDLSAQGKMWGDDIGEAFGSGGLGLTGNGEGAGGRGAGIGLGDIGGLGHGRGLGTGQGFGPGGFGESVGRKGGTHVAQAPRMRPGTTTVSGRLPPEVIQRVVRQNFGRFRMCYEQGLGRNPNLEGRVAARFVIGRDGAVSNVSNGGSDLADASVTSCVLSAFYGVSFPPPEGGIVTVTYPLLFTPG